MKMRQQFVKTLAEFLDGDRLFGILRASPAGLRVRDVGTRTMPEQNTESRAVSVPTDARWPIPGLPTIKGMGFFYARTSLPLEGGLLAVPELGTDRPDGITKTSGGGDPAKLVTGRICR